MHRHLARAGLADPPQHQRSQGRDTIDQPIRTLCNSYIPKCHRQGLYANIGH